MPLRKLRLPDIIDGLRRARHDDRIHALVAKVGGHIGLARMQEIREAVEGFRESGKLTVAWTAAGGEPSRRGIPPTTWPPRSTRITCSPRAVWA